MTGIVITNSDVDRLTKYGLVCPYAGTVDFVMSYCHLCLNDNSLTELLPDLERQGVATINASPMAMGLLTNRVGA